MCPKLAMPMATIQHSDGAAAGLCLATIWIARARVGVTTTRATPIRLRRQRGDSEGRRAVPPYLCRDRTSSAWSRVVGVELLRVLVVRAHGWRDADCCARGRPALLRSATLGLAPGPAT